MSNSTCTIPQCGKPFLARGYCKSHYRRFMRYGDALTVKASHGTLEERFWPKVDKRGPAECWPWTAYTNASGYGTLTIHRVVHFAHRVSYEVNVGPIPDGLTIDHVAERGCTRKDCVNPAHLEAVTQRTNTLRAPKAASTVNLVKTHCLHGHEFTTDNTYVGPNGGRRCRICRANQKASPNRRAKSGPSGDPLPEGVIVTARGKLVVEW